MRKRKIKSNVNDIIDKVIKEIRKELMASTKELEPSCGVNNTESTPVIKDKANDNAETNPKKRGRKKKEAELIKENDSLSVEDDIDYSQIKKSKNTSLINAKKAKNDEFYTDYSEIEKELAHYSEHFKDKRVLCNCDDPYYSEFWRYFKVRFEVLGLKKLIGTHYDNKNLPSYAIEFSRDEKYTLSYKDSETLKKRYNANNFELDSISDCKIHWLNGDGDFRSDECIKYLKECDIVVTNPPFSLFREFISLLESFDKKFIILGNNNVLTYSEFFPLIRDNKVWAGFGFNKVMKFIIPDSYELKGNGYIDKDDGKKRGFAPSMSWFTNLPIKKRKEDLILTKTYNHIDYPKYDNYHAINVDKVKDIPMDYSGVMGVPVTFVDRYNPDQFEIVGITLKCLSGEYFIEGLSSKNPTVNGKSKYMRILIVRKK